MNTFRAQVARQSSDPAMFLIVVPVLGKEGCDALTAMLKMPEQRPEPFVILYQAIAAHITQWHLREEVAQSATLAEHTAAIVELISHVATCTTVREACFTIATELTSFLGADLGVVGLVRGHRVTIETLSNASKLDAHSERARLLRNAMEESLVRNTMTHWPPTPDDRHGTIAHGRVAKHLAADRVLSMPISGPDGVVAVLLFLNPRQPEEEKQQRSFLQASAPHLANVLSTVRTAQGSWVRQGFRRWRGHKTWHRVVIVVATLLVAGAMVVPVPHHIHATCELQPMSRRFAVAPYNGVLRESLAKPGDLVQAGQVLSRMDDRELRIELARLAAKREQASKEHDTHLSNEQITEAQMAQLELKRLDLQIQLLREREAHLEITSAIHGVVIDGDLDDARGAPVEIGQLLFEIAPLDTLKLEVAIPEYDLSQVDTYMSVRALLDGAPHGWVGGQIQRIKPRAEVKQDKNVFVAEVVLKNPDRTLRPGMQGEAKIVSRPRMLGWILFHRTWHRVRSTIGW